MTSPYISNKFQSQSNIISSYNYTDIAEGTGVVIFYGYTTNESGTTTYRLSSTPTYSNDIETLNTYTTKYFYLAPFNLPKIIRGYADVICTAIIHPMTSDDVTFAFTATVEKWDGSTATTIGSATSETMTEPDYGAGVFQAKTLRVTINCSETHFKIGEQLRLKFEMTITGSLASGGYVGYGHDPQNRDGAAIKPSSPPDDPITTQFIFLCPFKIEEI